MPWMAKKEQSAMYLNQSDFVLRISWCVRKAAEAPVTIPTETTDFDATIVTKQARRHRDQMLGGRVGCGGYFR